VSDTFDRRLAPCQQRGAPQAPRPDNAQSLEHINAAKKLAADDALSRISNNFFCVAGNARAQTTMLRIWIL
jgi:hypothetical protein